MLWCLLFITLIIKQISLYKIVAVIVIDDDENDEEIEANKNCMLKFNLLKLIKTNKCLIYMNKFQLTT